jgi:hypothetical protein
VKDSAEPQYHKSHALHTDEELQRPDKLRRPGLRGLPAALWQGGNAAFSRLLERSEHGRPIEPQHRSWLERLFAADLSDVRVHSDKDAAAAAGALEAAAFTRGEDIYVADEAAPDLLAHEVAHVLQQRHATRLDASVGERGSGFEQAAHSATNRAGGAANVPAVQRQHAEDRASRAEVQEALTQFLTRALAAQGSRYLRVTPQVRDAVLRLFQGNPLGYGTTEAWLKTTGLPGDPAEFAAQVARRLPASVDRSLLTQLGRMAAGPVTPGRVERIKHLVEKSAAGEPEKKDDNKEPTSEEKFERGVEDLRRMRGQPSPTTVGPYSVDVLRAARIAQGLGQAWSGKTPPKAASGPTARTYPEVEAAIEKIAADALVPAAARGKPEADNYAEAREVARDLARRLDIAQQQQQTSIDLRLPASYASAPDRATLEQALENIVHAVRDSLPHHASAVRQVNVWFGNRLVKWIAVSSAP